MMVVRRLLGAMLARGKVSLADQETCICLDKDMLTETQMINLEDTFQQMLAGLSPSIDLNFPSIADFIMKANIIVELPDNKMI